MVDETLKLSNDLTYRYYRPQMAGSDGASDSSAALHAALRERGYSTLGSRHAVLARLPQRTLACLDATMSAATMSASTTSAATTAAEALPLAKCYINLATRPDRRRDMEQAMQIAGLIGVQRIEAVTGDAVSDSLVGLYWNTALNAKFDRNCEVESALAMSSGERGCAASHAAAWARCVASGSPLLVMEDDVKFADGIDVGDTVRALVAAIEVGLAAHERTLLLYLGADAYIREGAPSLRGKQAIWAARGASDTITLKEAEWAWQTHAYVVWPAAARMLLDSRPIDAPVDVWFSRFFYERRLVGLVAQPMLATQHDPYKGGDVFHSSLANRPDFGIDHRQRHP
jgi:GR25 family glycosyltransferase involved in LPS biosynthesis